MRLALAATFSGLPLDSAHLGLWLRRQTMMYQRILGLKFILRVLSIHLLIVGYKIFLCADGKLLSEVGCFRDLDSGSYWINTENTTFLTVDWCLNHCKTNGMKF